MRSSPWTQEGWADVRLLQLSVLGLLLLDFLLQKVGGVLNGGTAWTWTGVVLALAATAFALVQPAATRRAGVVTALCLVDLAAIGLARLSPEDGGIGLLAVLPAVWLSAVLGRAGAVLGAAAALLLITAPGLAYGSIEGEFLASSVPVPGVVLIVGIAVSEGLRRAAAARERSEQDRADLEVALDTLRAESRRTQAIIDTADVGLLLIEPDGSLGYANLPAKRALAVAFPRWREDDRDLSSALVFDEDGANLVTGADQPAARIARGEEFSDVRVWIGPRGARRLLLVSGRQLDFDGSRGGGVLAFSDITEKERSLRLRTSFINAVAHELRTPLMSLDAYLSLLRDVPDLSEEARALLPALDRSSRRLRRLGAQLVRDSGTDQWSMRASREPVDLDVLIDEVCTRFAAARLDGCAEKIERRLTAGISTQVDKELFTQMLEELLANACRHSPDDSPVAVALGINPGEGVEITISDLGPGIDSSRHLSIFEPTREMLAPDSTLSGLPLCRAVAAAHGGHLEIDSRLAGGATFIVSLPLHAR